jgi:hypothetical protein
MEGLLPRLALRHIENRGNIICHIFVYLGKGFYHGLLLDILKTVVKDFISYFRNIYRNATAFDVTTVLCPNRGKTPLPSVVYYGY